MTNRYVAFGLEFQSSFVLPGMASSEADELPSLELELASTAELTRAWSGSDGPSEWRGRQGDGLDLVIQRGATGDRLFSYGDRARFLLDATERRLLCTPSRPGLDWQRVLIGKVLPTIGVIRGFEALHAAALNSPEGVVAIMAPSGMGKSTLAVELMRRGWPLFADDVLILQQTDGKVRAHPGSPHMNVAESLPAGFDPQTLGDTLGILSGERWLSVHASASLPGTVHMLCLLERAPSLMLDLKTLPSTPLALAPHMLGLSTDPARQRERFRLYADLIESATLVRLTAGADHGPAELADLLEERLMGTSQPAAAAQARPTAEPVAGGVA